GDGGTWTAAHVQDIEAGLKDGGWARGPLVRYVEDECFQQGAVLRQIVATESGKFSGRHDSAEDFSRLNALLSQLRPGFSFPRIALPFL
ncbi:hypothetical protein NPN14_24565, partial [Vibrio parahaemolyticus]|uniref:hypothetical protein n=1 Tax=Vibrio parahaemolyticus TaxID=670 RepID=UPI002110F099